MQSEDNTPATASEVTPLRELSINAGIVFAGGTLGALIRALIASPNLPGTAHLVAILAINVIGALALAAITARALPHPWRLALGTGLCGGYTTYSAIATDAATGIASGSPTALGFAAANVVLGLAASALGWWLGTRLRGGEARA